MKIHSVANALPKLSAKENADNESEYADMTPVPHALWSLMNQNLSWPKVLGELIDNSLDAGANRVVVYIDGRAVVVEDDGRGIKDVESVLKIGVHTHTETTRLGVYGVGLKDAWLHCGGPIAVDTVRASTRTTIYVDPMQVMSGCTWKYKKPVTEFTEDDPGTRITLGLRPGRNRPSPDTAASLAWIFTPGIQQGKQILTSFGSKQRTPLTAIKLPYMSEAVRDEFVVNGRSVKIDIGILSDGETMHRGPFWIAHGHRNILNSAVGAKNYSTQRMGGTIVLGDGWVFSKNKDDLTDFRDELEDAVFLRIEPLLLKAEQLSNDIESLLFKNEIEGLLNCGISKFKKERRPGKSTHIGTIQPVNTGVRRRKAKEVQDGDGSIEDASKRVRRGFSCDWYSDEDDPRAGEFDAIGNRVRFNSANNFVSQCRSDSNAMALCSIGTAIIANHSCSRDGNSNLLLVALADFNDTYGAILSSVNRQGGNRVSTT